MNTTKLHINCYYYLRALVHQGGEALRRAVRLLPLVLVLASLSSCWRRPLEEEFWETALIPIIINWDTLAHLDPTRDTEDLYCASVWIYCKDGAPFNGKSYMEVRLDDPRGGYLELPIGHYSLIVINNATDIFSDNVHFEGTDSYHTFKYLVDEGLQPDILAAWHTEEYEVTRNMVYVSRGYTDAQGYNEASGRKDLTQLLNLPAQPLTCLTHVKAHVQNIKSAARAMATLTGMGASVSLATFTPTGTGHTTTFQLNNRKYDDTRSKHGTTEAWVRTLCMSHDTSEAYTLQLWFTLLAPQDGSTTYPTPPAPPLTFDVTQRLQRQPAYHCQEGAHHCIHFGLKGADGNPETDDDADPIVLPDVYSDSGFQPIIDDWGEEIPIDIPIK